MQTLMVTTQQLSEQRGELDERLSEHECLVVVPAIDAVLAQRALTLAAHRSSSRGLLLAVMDNQRWGLVRVHNWVYRHSRSLWYGYLAQDAFAGRDWLALAMRCLDQTGASLLGFNDGKWHGQMASFGLARREWVSSVYGDDFFYSGYHSHFADTELSLIARQQSVYAYEPQAVVVEIDWQKDILGGVRESDRELFQSRSRTGFEGRVSSPVLRGLFS